MAGQRRDEEAVGGRLDGAAFSVRAASYDGEAGFHGGPLEIGIDFVIAEVLFFDHFLAVVASEIRSGTQVNFGHQSGEFGGVLGTFWDGAGHGINARIRRVRVLFGSRGVFHAEDVARALDERVLKSAARTQIRPVATSGALDALDHAVEALIGAAGGSPKAVEGL